MERKDTIRINKQNTKMIAHRGLSSLERENTICAFIAGGNRSYYGMECDIYPTTDHRYVIMHDKNTKRVSKHDMDIVKYSYPELNDILLVDPYDQEEKPYLRIPLLEDYLKICIKYGKIAVIEYKISYNPEQLYEVVEMVRNYGYLENTVFISFFLKDLITVREKYPEVKIQFLTTDWNQELLETCHKYQLGIDIYWEAVSKEMIDKFHQYNLEVNAWTVNDKEIGEKLVSYGIDYITTNILE